MEISGGSFRFMMTCIAVRFKTSSSQQSSEVSAQTGSLEKQNHLTSDKWHWQQLLMLNDTGTISNCSFLSTVCDFFSFFFFKVPPLCGLAEVYVFELLYHLILTEALNPALTSARGFLAFLYKLICGWVISQWSFDSCLYAVLSTAGVQSDWLTGGCDFTRRRCFNH